MVEIRVAVPDAAEVDGLFARLAALFGRPSVSFDGAHNEIRSTPDCSFLGSLTLAVPVAALVARPATDGATALVPR